MPNPFAIEGEWLKGNTHAHTTNSDGNFTPQEIVDMYAEWDYQFLVPTDHDCVTPVHDLDDRGMTLIPGIEMAIAGCHVVGLDIEQNPEMPDSDDPAELTAALAEQCGACILGHPFWSVLSYDHIASMLPHCIGVEIFNTYCHLVGRGTSEYMWNLMLDRGHKIWAVAADDIHGASFEGGKGWVIVKAADNHPQTIMQALREGLFYASSGPTIHNVEHDGEFVHVDCSPCQEVLALKMGGGSDPTTYHMDIPRPFEHVEIPWPDPEKPYRIVCIDQTGRRAWTNPFLI